MVKFPEKNKFDLAGYKRTQSNRVFKTGIEEWGFFCMFVEDGDRKPWITQTSGQNGVPSFMKTELDLQDRGEYISK